MGVKILIALLIVLLIGSMGNSIKIAITSAIKSNPIGRQWSQYAKWVTGKCEVAELKVPCKTRVSDFLWDGSEKGTVSLSRGVSQSEPPSDSGTRPGSAERDARGDARMASP
jgi:hypothetical protein